jgi:pyruvyltransferase
MKDSQPIPLFWWSEPRLMGKKKENYGDLLSKYLVEKISGRKIIWVHPKKQAWYKLNKSHYLTTGSILAQASKKSIVWGSGIIDRNQPIAEADFRAVRGPETRNFLLNLGYECPETYGDPAVLLPDLYAPKVVQEFELGIIPHYVDHSKVSNLIKENQGIRIIDMMTMDVEKTTREILTCKKIISSSLHGLIVAHSYGIPAVWLRFSQNVFGDDVKFYDYFQSVGMKVGDPGNVVDFDPISLKEWFLISDNLPDQIKMIQLKKGLMEACPFK